MHALRIDPPGAEFGAKATDVPVEDFVRRHQVAVWRLLRALGCPTHEAEELTQDAFLLALDRGVHEGDERAAGAFVRQTARHLWLHRQRDDRRRHRLLLAAAERLWQRDCERDDGAGLLAALDQCVQSLEGRSRRALDLFYREGCSRAELAQALGLGEHGARTLLQRVRAILKACVTRKARA